MPDAAWHEDSRPMSLQIQTSSMDRPAHEAIEDFVDVGRRA